MLRQENHSINVSFVSQILFPVDELVKLKTHAFLVGWNLDNFRCCIGCAVEIPNDQYEQLSEVIRSCSIEMSKLLTTCSKDGNVSPVILGEWVPKLNVDYVPDVLRRMEGIWITLTSNRSKPQSKHPQLHSLYSLGCLYNTSCYLFEYNCVDTDRLNCLKADNYLHEQMMAKTKSLSLGSELDYIVAQINASRDLLNLINYYLNKNIQSDEHMSSNRLTSIISTLSSLIVTVPSWLWYSAMRRVERALRHKYVMLSLSPILTGCLGLRGDADGTSSDKISSGDSGKKKAGSTSDKQQEGISWCDVSLTAAHLSEKITRFEGCFRKCAVFPHSWALPARLKQTIWVSVYSHLWVLWLDVLIGFVIGYFAFTNAGTIVRYIEQTSYRAQKRFIMGSMTWFNQSPGGVKLNSLVTTKVGATLRAIVNTYHTVLVDTKALHLPVTKLVACCGALGVSTQLMLLIDVMRLTTLHIAITHRILAFFHQQQLQLLYSFYLLFMGQKNNVLRKRIDNCEFDQSQLLFGIVLFTIAIFFFPSFAAFYYLFAFAQCGVVALQYVLWSTAVAVKEFPLYRLGLYFSNPDLLTTGLQFDIIHVDSGGTTAAGGSNVQSPQSVPFVGASSPPFFDQSATHEKSKQCDVLNKSGDISCFFEPTLVQPEVQQLKADDTHPADSTAVKSILKPHQAHARSPHTHRREAPSLSVHFDLADISNSDDSDVSSPSSPPPALMLPFGPRRVGVGGVDALNLLSSNSFGRGGAAVDGLSSSNSRSGYDGKKMLSWDELNSSTNYKNRQSEKESFQHVGESSARNCAVHLRLKPRKQTLTEVFSGYFPYLQYISSEKEFIWRVLQGVCSGRPALDIQLVHATAFLDHSKSLQEQLAITSAFSSSNLSRVSTSGINKRRNLHRDSGSSSNSAPFTANCFRTGDNLLNTVKNRKGFSSTASLNKQGSSSPGFLDETPTSPILLSSSSSTSHKQSVDYTVVYDLLSDGFTIQTSFWETLRLASLDDSAADSEDSTHSTDSADAKSDDVQSSHSPIPSRVNKRQRRLSAMMLYSVLMTAALSLLVTSIGGAVFTVSLLPPRWGQGLIRPFTFTADKLLQKSRQSVTTSMLTKNRPLVSSSLSSNVTQDAAANTQHIATIVTAKTNPVVPKVDTSHSQPKDTPKT